MKVRGLSGSLVIRGKEFAKLGKWEFERSKGDPEISVHAEVKSVDRFLSRYVESTTVLAELDIQRGRLRPIHSLSMGELEASFVALWAETAEESGTGTNG